MITDPAPFVLLDTGNGSEPHSVAVLVLETFVGPRPEGHVPEHLNGDPNDNRLVNLRWTPAEEHPQSRLTRRQRRERDRGKRGTCRRLNGDRGDC